MGSADSNDILLIILCIFLPPAAVWLKDSQKCECPFWLNLCLTLFLGIPGVIHAFWFCFCRN